jgi:DNA-binding NtrC family response regulator
MIAYASKTSNGQKVSILIVDDQRHVSRLVATAIREKGIQVDIADSVGKSWKYLRECQPAAVLLNSLSEGFDCFDLLNAIKEKLPEIPAIVYAIRSADGIDRLKETIEEVLKQE